ncbi:HK97 family phage prohead protease [uncultured Tateyamaria sp.]|uniref:HK97 family phage prohead protease n=1 Tax=Tateyamaria sp. 1078 TaxID=3417464 RepID=UPI00260C864C|nr:HK97 family phage prohead protease [uncultured Tateyamaria sp.]
MLEGRAAGAVETRFAFDGSAIIEGVFPYGERASFGADRFETFAPGAFADSVQSEADIHFVWQHDMGKPLASRAGGSLTLNDAGNALRFEARISADHMAIGFVKDAVAAMQTSLVKGLSPGFRVSSAKDQVVTREGNNVLRTIKRAELIELSAVTKGAYPYGQVQARNWTPEPSARSVHVLSRWRA